MEAVQATTSVEVPQPRAGRRRRFSNTEKRSILDEASAPGESISSVGRRYALSVSLLFRWKRQLEALQGTGRLSPRAALIQRLAELELQLDAVKAENTLLRDTLERSRREGRVLAVPARSAEDLRANGRA